MHPFMLEGVLEEKRRKSSVMPSRDMILNYVAKLDRDEVDKVDTHNFDENYMMFGGDKYLKVRIS
jgi:hypothetical protein